MVTHPPIGTFVPIPAGWFDMGSADGQADEAPVHRVWVDRFEMAAYPVTRQEYAIFLREAAHTPPREWESRDLDGSERPAVGVSWHDAYLYCIWRSSCRDAIRLPTEAEWEHAARHGAGASRYPWGDRIPSWIPSGGRGPLTGPWPVTLGEPTPAGLFGLSANIHEWCADWHGRDFYDASPTRNPIGPDRGVRRASRGGAWRHAVTISRSSQRSKLAPNFRYTDYGFRVARDGSVR
jgi:formylglycine-generating enzyme required for sulfatase activity